LKARDPLPVLLSLKVNERYSKKREQEWESAEETKRFAGRNNNLTLTLPLHPLQPPQKLGLPREGAYQRQLVSDIFVSPLFPPTELNVL
jgi:hypothetical protein